MTTDTDKKKILANDLRWRLVDRYENLIAIIRKIDECHRVIEVNVTNANPRDIGQNQDNIEREVSLATKALQKLQRELQQLRDDIETDVRSEYQE